jgi:hypothetical protein
MCVYVIRYFNRVEWRWKEVELLAESMSKALRILYSIYPDAKGHYDQHGYRSDQPQIVKKLEGPICREISLSQ